MAPRSRASAVRRAGPLAVALLLLADAPQAAHGRRAAQSAVVHNRASHEPEPLATTGCPSRNQKLSNWIRSNLDAGTPLIPQSTTFDAFVLEIKAALEQHHLPMRTIQYLFSDASPFHPTCSGRWLEFGVFRGDTSNWAAQNRLKRCGDRCPPMFGFDTFTGLPEKWDRDGSTTFAANAFDQGGVFPQVDKNVQLVKGLFSESLPAFLAEQAKYAGGNETVSYLHIDCDLYAGSRDAFTILSGFIKPGTVIVFDELVNYANFRDHEIKAFWEWLQATGSKVLPYGIAGPLPGKTFAVDLDISDGEHPWFHQSAAFVVVSQPAAAHNSQVISLPTLG